MFYGASVHTLDPKGRLFVPKRFADALSRTADGTPVAFLSRGPDACLYLFTEGGFQVALDEIQTRVFPGQDLRAAQRVFFANTARVELDASGRVLIPEKLRASASIEKEVVMVGVGDRAEIWCKSTWQLYEARHIDKLDHIDRVIAAEAPDTAP